MPETSMHEYDFPATCEYKVGLPWEINPMQSVTIAHIECKTTYKHFRASITVFHRPHNTATKLRRAFYHER